MSPPCEKGGRNCDGIQVRTKMGGPDVSKRKRPTARRYESEMSQDKAKRFRMTQVKRKKKRTLGKVL